MANTKLGLRANWFQFSLLVLINGFVGSMVGLERSIFPEFAAQVFGLDSHTALLSFIMAFGLSKALSNYLTGRLANRFGRRNLLLLGWMLALPVPLILLFASSWNVVVAANVLLGLSQGFAWSSTVVMKIDLVGPKQRGLAMGINEFAGYFAIGLTAFLTGYLAANYGIKPYPFYLGIALAVLGFLLSLAVRDTRAFVQQEANTQSINSSIPLLKNIFLDTSFKNPSLGAITQAGLVNNLNDGMMWGLFPIFLADLHFKGADIAWLVALYPTIWGLGQLFTGKLSDTFSHKKMLFWGMALQGIVILILPFASNFTTLTAISATLGLGTAIVYPTFLAGIAAASPVVQRAETVGVFRLWRDLGYALGALLSGLLADAWGLHVAILAVGALTLLSALYLAWRMPTSN